MEPTQIKLIVKTVFEGAVQVSQGRTTYLRALIEASQEALPKGADKDTQLATINATHVQFYEIVLSTAEDFVPKGTKDRGTELHRLGTFARTSVSALRMHVRAGGDLATLKADKVTKHTLKKPDRPEPTARRVRGAVQRGAKQFMATVETLAKVDKAAALEELQFILDYVSYHIAEMGERKPPRRAPRMVPHASPADMRH